MRFRIHRIWRRSPSPSKGPYETPVCRNKFYLPRRRAPGEKNLWAGQCSDHTCRMWNQKLASLNDCKDGLKHVRWLEFQPLNRFFTAYAQEIATLGGMTLSRFPDKLHVPMDSHPLSAYHSGFHLRAIRCWPQDRAPKLDSG